MKTIWLKDLKLKEVVVVEEVVEEEVEKTKRKPLFLWMKEEDIYKIEYFYDYIRWYNKDWLEIYYENSDKYWRKKEYKDWLPTYYEDSDKFWWKREYKDWLETYFEDSNKFWSKKEDWKKIEYDDWRYYIDWEEAELR